MARVYISSTSQDLSSYRKKAIETVAMLRHAPVAMEDYYADGQPPLAKCLADVDAADIYIGIFAWRYGFIPDDDVLNPERRSITELEWRRARDGGKPCLIYLVDRSQPWSPDFYDEGEGLRKLKALRAQLEKDILVSYFKKPSDLGKKIALGLQDAAAALSAPTSETTGGAPITHRLGTLPPPVRAAIPPNNLPQQITTFIGRSAQIDRVLSLLDQHRMVTLTGAGGSGKTRLAEETAFRALERFTGGCWKVELAPLRDPDLVPHAIASTLGCSEDPGTPILNTVARSIGLQKVLIVLDNCEHVIKAAADACFALLRDCAGVRILATSQEKLYVAGEQTYAVPRLTTPSAERALSLIDLMEDESVQLFVQRAQLSDADFTVDENNARSVAELCRALEGIPLAIELAAPRVGAFGIDEIVARVGDRFRFLTGGSRHALPRQRTLKATIDWSYDLLTEQQRTLLRRLSVFAGGWTVAAAESVCGYEDVDAAEVLNLLQDLIDKSLVQRYESRSGARYRLLETLREYGRQRLDEEAGTDCVRCRHFDYFLQLARRSDEELIGRNHNAWLQKLDEESANIWAALDWSCALGSDQQARRAVELAAPLWRYWYLRGHISKGCDALEKALRCASDASRELIVGKALYGAGVLTQVKCSYDEAVALLRRGLAIAEEHADLSLSASILNALGHIADDTGDYAQAQEMLERSVALHDQAGNPRGKGVAMMNLANLYYSLGRYEDAIAALSECIDAFRDGDDKGSLADAIYNLGLSALEIGDYGRAIGCFDEGIRLHTERDDRAGVGYALSGRARAKLSRVDAGADSQMRLLVEAYHDLQSAVRIACEQEEYTILTASLTTSADVAARMDAYPVAAKLLSAADILRKSLKVIVPQRDADRNEALERSVRERLGDSEFDRLATETTVRSAPDAATLLNLLAFSLSTGSPSGDEGALYDTPAQTVARNN